MKLKVIRIFIKIDRKNIRNRPQKNTRDNIEIKITNNNVNNSKRRKLALCYRFVHIQLIILSAAFFFIVIIILVVSIVSF